MALIAQTLETGLHHHHAGRLEQAEQAYRQILAAEPTHAEALHLLGVLACQQSRYDVSLEYFRQAIAANPGNGDYHCNLGVAYQNLGRLDEAVVSFEQALRLRPDNAVACYNLGNIRQHQGRLDEAVAWLQRSLRLRPDADGHSCLGNALLAQDKLAEAVASYDQALLLRADFGAACNNRGIALCGLGRLEEGVASFRNALRLQPNYADAYNNLASALARQGHLDEAAVCYQHVLRLQPNSGPTYQFLHLLHMQMGHVGEAAACLREALRIQPDNASAHSSLLACLNYDPLADPVAVYTEHCRWGQVHGAVPRLPPPRDRDRNPERRLRIGYVSPDLRRHAVARYFEPVLAHHDRRQVEVFCYAQVPAPDAVTTRLQALAKGWRWTCGRSADEVAQEVRADGIDILVDLAGHMAHNRLDVFARKPAPVQVTWLGYPNTTGLTTVDYRLTDDVMDPPGQPVLDTEELFRLPGGMCCFTTPEDAPAVSPMPAQRRGYLTFGSLHSLAKLNGQVFDLWCRMLQAVPTARLLMFRHTLLGQTREYIRRQFTERGIADERLDLREGTDAPGYLAIYDEIDVSLDVFPYSGGTTTCESLWMGSPMLSLEGLRPPARGSAMLLAIVGLSDWVAPTPEAYVALAERWSQDLDALAAVRAGLRERMRGTLCDARRFTRGLEDAYRTMWRRWCAQNPGHPSFNLGTVLQDQGRWAEAVECYRQLLRLQPDSAAAHHELGNALQALERLEEASASYRQALRFEPDQPVILNNLGNSLAKQGRLADAVESYRGALALQPDNAAVHCNLATAQRNQGNLDEAVLSYGEAIRLQPAYAPAHYNLGNALLDQGKQEEAERHYREAVRLQPDFPEAHLCLGNALKCQGKEEDAARSYLHALQLKPDNPAACSNLGHLRQHQGKLDEAVGWCQQALRLRPDAEGHANLGDALLAQGKAAKAAACYEQALLLRPDFAAAHHNRGVALSKLGRLEDGIASFQQALSLQPDNATACNDLGIALYVAGRVAEAVTNYQQALRLLPGYPAAHSNLLLALNYDPDAEPAAVYAEHCRWGQLHGAVAELPAHPDRDRRPERRLRIGYVSPDLRRHAVIRYFEPVLAHHDPQKVEVFCYAEVAAPDAVTARLQVLAQGWRWTCGRSADEVAEQVRADGIDILVDLAGHTGNHRLDVFARKPAPVQVTWLGYPNTTGLTSVDYRLTDAVMDPPGQPVLDTEELFRLPGGMCCFTMPEDAPPVSPLPALRKGHLTFGSLHTLAKLNGRVFDLWCRVLQAVPTARLLMFRHTLVGQTREFIRRQFTARGIADERLDLRRGTEAVGYLSIYDEIDVSLDAFPYSGGTTTCESLWMGAPMLSLAGVRPAARGSAMLLAIVGLSDWVVQTPEAYVARAVQCATDLDALAAVRAGLRERMRGTLCDARRFTRGLEEVYRTMWRRWCAQAGST